MHAHDDFVQTAREPAFPEPAETEVVCKTPPERESLIPNVEYGGKRTGEKKNSGSRGKRKGDKWKEAKNSRKGGKIYSGESSLNIAFNKESRKDLTKRRKVKSR